MMTLTQVLGAVGMPSLEESERAARARRHLSARLAATRGLSGVIDALAVLALFAAVRLAFAADGWSGGLDDVLSMRVTLRTLLAAATATVVCAFALRLFRVGVCAPDAQGEASPWCVLAAFLVCAVAASLLFAASGVELLTFWIAGSVAVLLVATGRPRWRQRQRERTRRRVLVAGTGPLACRIVDALASHPDTSFDIVGFIDTPGATPVAPAIAGGTVGSLDALEVTLMRDQIDEVYIALPVKSHYREIQVVLSTCERIGVPAKYRADFFQADVAWPRYDAGSDQLVTMQVTQDGPGLFVKRLLDVVGAALLLVMLAPVLAAVALTVRLTGGPVFYTQERYGLNRRRFHMLKFRTMVVDAERLQASLEQFNDADGPVFKIARDTRITPVGRWLRRTSLDELPQLVNVLRGEMSLVGPRPLPLRDVARFTEASDMRRFSVRPGLTCLWQVSGRSNLSFTEWMRLDLTYIDRWSLGLDLLILARTLPAVLRGTGAH